MSSLANDSGLSPLLLDVEETSRLLGGISRGHLDNLVRRGVLPSVNVGRRRMFRASDVTAYVDSLADHQDRAAVAAD